MRLLYLYSEEWTGHRAREVHTLSTCVALAQSGFEVTLVTAGGQAELEEHLHDIAGTNEVAGLNLVTLSRTLGPIRSTAIFSRNFNFWRQTVPAFHYGYIIHLKAGPLLQQAGIPYAYEAHEIFSQTPQNPVRQRKLHLLEGQVLASAAKVIATSKPLAQALNTWFSLTKDFAVVPNAGLPPLDHGVSDPEGPFVYCGSISEWKGLDTAMAAAQAVGVPLRIIGGTEDEWRLARERVEMGQVEWQPRVPFRQVAEVLAGARAGLIPTNFDLPSGEFSCPMKLFDYARCGLPVLTTALPSLQSLEVGPWCTQVPSPTLGSWVDSLERFQFKAAHADAARTWAAEHTWKKRAERLQQVFLSPKTS